MGSGVGGCCLLCFELTWSLAQTQCKQAGEIDSSICPGFDMQWICKYVRTYIIIDYIYHYINSHITSCNIINDIVRDILTTCTSSTNKLRGNQLGSFSYIKFRKYMSSSFWGVGPQVVRSEIPRFLRNFLLWSLQPGEHLKHAFAYQEGDQDPAKKAGLFPYVVHGCWLLIHASLICLPLGEEGQLSCDSFLQLVFFGYQASWNQPWCHHCLLRVSGVFEVLDFSGGFFFEAVPFMTGPWILRHFGLVFIFALANLLMAPVGILSSTVLAPPTISKSYAFRMGPLTVIFPIFGFGIATGQQKTDRGYRKYMEITQRTKLFLGFQWKRKGIFRHRTVMIDDSVPWKEIRQGMGKQLGLQ